MDANASMRRGPRYELTNLFINDCSEEEDGVLLVISLSSSKSGRIHTPRAHTIPEELTGFN